MNPLFFSIVSALIFEAHYIWASCPSLLLMTQKSRGAMSGIALAYFEDQDSHYK